MFYDPKFMTPEAFNRVMEEVKTPQRFRNSLRALQVAQDYDVPAILPTINCPVLFAWGDHDRITPLSDWRPYLHLFKDFQLVEFKECGHSPLIEKHQEFNAVLLDFLKRKGGLG
jgi:pimeloyl-ACP methyl ester carboxylesterase